MSAIAVEQNGYVKRDEKVSLTEKLRKYFKENEKVIVSGLLMMNGSNSAYQVYRMMK